LSKTLSNVRKPLPCGLRTHRREFILPILLTLDELGGSASIQKVMPALEAKMRGTLNRFDYEVLESGKGRSEYRWRNTARWAKNILVNLGLVASGSPIGLWELTYAGEDFVAALR
jgi:restriction system protein